MSQTELEFKLEVPPERRAAVEAAVRTATARRTHLQARYFDTADGALATQGVVLRLRKEGRRWVQTAKARGDGPLQRHEHNVDLGVAARGVAPVPDLQRHQGTAVGQLLERALEAGARDGVPAVLLERHATDVWRTTREVRVAGAVVELAFDLGRVTAGERSATICELELELLRGDPAALAALADRWASRFGLWLSTTSKAERGERLARGAERSPAVKAAAPRYGDEPSGRQLLVAVVGTCLAQILPNASEVAAGSDDAEHIHQLRVGVRRLRTALRDLGALDGPVPVAWEPALEEAFRALGTLRDHEVMQQLIEPRLRAAGGPPIEWPAPIALPVAPAGVVRSAPLQAVLIDLLRYTIDTRAATDEAAEAMNAHAARKHLRRTLDKLHRALARDAEAFVQLPLAEQHHVRKRLKRLRYLAEFAAPLFDSARAARLLKRIEAAQDALGQYNDESVALATARAAIADDPRAWFAVGWLGARNEPLAQACVEPLKRLGKAQPFWPRVKKKKKKAPTPD